ncbi:uncharacterized protein O9250_005847 isoform 1-T1 [Rhynochetos jubatus]
MPGVLTLVPARAAIPVQGKNIPCSLIQPPSVLMGAEHSFPRRQRAPAHTDSRNTPVGSGRHPARLEKWANRNLVSSSLENTKSCNWFSKQLLLACRAWFTGVLAKPCSVVVRSGCKLCVRKLCVSMVMKHGTSQEQLCSGSQSPFRSQLGGET